MDHRNGDFPSTKFPLYHKRNDIWSNKLGFSRISNSFSWIYFSWCLFLFTKESNIFSIDWRKEKGRENINCFVLFLYIFNSQIGQNFGQNPPNIFFWLFWSTFGSFFGQIYQQFNWLCDYHRRVKKTLYIALLYTVHIHFDCYPKRDYNIGDETFNSKSQLWCIVYTKTCLGASLFIFYIENINF